MPTISSVTSNADGYMVIWGERLDRVAQYDPDGRLDWSADYLDVPPALDPAWLASVAEPEPEYDPEWIAGAVARTRGLLASWGRRN